MTTYRSSLCHTNNGRRQKAVSRQLYCTTGVGWQNAYLRRSQNNMMSTFRLFNIPDSGQRPGAQSSGQELTKLCAIRCSTIRYVLFCITRLPRSSRMRIYARRRYGQAAVTDVFLYPRPAHAMVYIAPKDSNSHCTSMLIEYDTRPLFVPLKRTVSLSTRLEPHNCSQPTG